MDLPKALNGKRILLISPQPWDHLPVSKHHYAEALGRANAVMFLSPPDYGLPPGALNRRATGTSGVDEIRWRPRVPRVLRFHAPALYGLLIAHEARRLAAWTGGAPDLVWCFDFNTFPDLRAFGAARAIFHPVDPIATRRQARIGATADLVLSVSAEILGSVTREVPEVPAEVVPHGIGAEFLELAGEAETWSGPSGHCGYFGNLDRPAIDVPLLAQVVAANPGVTFHFWGPTAPDGPFVTALGGQPNVRLHGPVAKDELVRQVRGMDAFLLAYREHGAESDLSNSHKILEYFATGRVVVATYMSCHAEAADLLLRTQRGDSAAFPYLFARVMADLATHNADDRMARRKALAAGHGYGALIQRIGRLLDRADRTIEETAR